MVTEIELKAHVKNNEELRRLLSEKAVFLHSFEKEDNYWFGENTSLPSSGLRIRREKRRFEDGREEIANLATFKTKEVRNAIEINDEREFAVDPVTEFEEFLRRLGMRAERYKKKKGWAFSKDGINAELVEVQGLGCFIELEIIADNNREETFAGARKKLMDFLVELGIDAEAIESRFYTEMLKDASSG